MKKFKAVLFEKDEFEHRDMSILTALLPLQANQDTSSLVENKFPENLVTNSKPQEKAVH